MKKFRAIALSVVSAFVLVAAPTVFATASEGNPQIDKNATLHNGRLLAAAAEPTCRRLSAANTAGQDILVGTGNPKTYTGTAWQNVACTETTFRLANGERAMVVSNFNAESDCYGTTTTGGQWCQARALLNGLEGYPLAPEPDSFAFDGIHGGVNNWQANSMQRAWEVRCLTVNGCQYRFAVQTRMHDTTVSGMWLDEVSAHIRVTPGAVAPL